MLDRPPVLTKKDFTGRYAAGEFGNASPTWSYIDEFLSMGRLKSKEEPSCQWSERYHLRNRIAGGETHYNLYWSQCVSRWIDQPNKELWYASEMAPHDLNLIQGEVLQGCYGSGSAGLDLYYSTARGLPMRDALKKEAHQISGVRSSMILRHYMSPNDWEWLNILLDRYPGHVVEFSTFDREWGTIPGFRTVYWEVRGGY